MSAETEKARNEYLRIQTEIIKIGRMANALDLDWFLTQISSAEAVAPMVDPTLYMKAVDNLRAVKELAKSLKPVQLAFDTTFAAVIKTAARGNT